MNTFPKRTAMVLAATTALAACGKTLWESTFNVDDDFATYGNVGALGNDGASYLGGYTLLGDDQSSVRRGFVAKFDAKGKPVWHKVLDEDSSTTIFGVEGLLPDPEGNVYVANILWDQPATQMLLTVTKLASTGELLWSWNGPTDPELLLKRDISLGRDGHLYIKTGSVLHSLTTEGQHRFTESAQPNVTNCMGWFHGNDYQHAYEVVHQGNSIRIIDVNDASDNGEFDYAASCVAMNTIAYAEVVDGDVYVFGRDASGQQLKGHVLRQSEYFRANEGDVEGIVLPTTPQYIKWSKFSGGGFCIAYSASNSLYTSFVDANLQTKWTNEHTLQGAPLQFDISDVVNTNGKCYTQYIDTLQDGTVSSVVIAEEQATGKAKAELKKADAVVMDIDVSGQRVLQSGFTGSYTTAEGMSAYLSTSLIK
jgi:hypothetical protein